MRLNVVIVVVDSPHPLVSIRTSLTPETHHVYPWKKNIVRTWVDNLDISFNVY